jgi:hypothetical protein
VDGPNAARITPEALQRWDDRLEAIFQGKPYDMLDAALSDTIKKFPLSIQVRTGCSRAIRTVWIVVRLVRHETESGSPLCNDQGGVEYDTCTGLREGSARVVLLSPSPTRSHPISDEQCSRP